MVCVQVHVLHAAHSRVFAGADNGEVAPVMSPASIDCFQLENISVVQLVCRIL